MDGSFGDPFGVALRPYLFNVSERDRNSEVRSRYAEAPVEAIDSDVKRGGGPKLLLSVRNETTEAVA